MLIQKDLLGENGQLEQASSLSEMEKVCESFSPQICVLDLEGNIRELRNIVQSIYVYRPEKELVEVEDVRETLLFSPGSGDEKLDEVSHEFEIERLFELPPKRGQERIREALLEKQMKRSRTLTELAHRFGIAPSNLHRKLKELGLI